MQGSSRFIYIFFNDNTHCETKKIGFNVGRKKKQQANNIRKNEGEKRSKVNWFNYFHSVNCL